MAKSSRQSVVIVTNQLKNIKSGVGTVAHSLINEVVKTYDLLIICPEEEMIKPTSKNITIISVTTYKSDPTNHHWLTFAWKAARMVAKLDSSEYKLVIFMDAREGYFSNKIDIPTLGIIHDFMSSRFNKLSWALVRTYPDWFKRLIYYKLVKKLEERAYGRIDNLVTVCDFTKQEIIKNYKIRQPISVIWNGIDFSRLKPQQGPKNKKTILFVCGNPYLKGLPELLHAVELVAKTEPDIKLYVVGEVNRKKLDPKSDHVIFTGHLNYQKAIQYFNDCQVFCMPSHFESFSMAYLEALYYNMQVIASKNTGTPEIKRYFSNLNIVDPEDIDQIASAILQALKNHQPTNVKNLDIISSRRMGQEYIRLIKHKISQSTKAEKANNV